jgi:hypothetical protein
MSVQNSFSKIKREIGIKKCIVIDGNVGDVFLNEKKKIITLKEYLEQILKELEYSDVYYWDRVDGLNGNTDALKITDDVEVKGEEYQMDDEPQVEKKKTGLFKDPNDLFPIVFKNLTTPNKKFAFILNWSEYLFTQGGMLPDNERQNITLLGKAIKDKKVEYLNSDVNESTVILIANKLSQFPLSFYQGNPEVSSITLQKPDRLERKNMIEKIETSFDIKLKAGESILTAEKSSEYVDMLDDFTSREIIQLSKLSRKERNLTFEKLFYLFKYGEKENPWEKIEYKDLKNIKKKLSERVVGQEEAISKIEKTVVKAYM